MASPDPPTTDFVHSLLLRAHSPETANRIFLERATQKPLPLRPSSPTPDGRSLRRKARDEHRAAAKKRKALKPRPLSAAQKRKLCLYEIPKDQQKYEIYEPLHALWVGYMREVLGIKEEGGGRAYITSAAAGPMIASADMHGAILEVVRSRCVSRVGLKGIVLRDSKFTFEIVTESNVVKSIPKEHTIFRLELPLPKKDGADELKPLVFEIHGEQFQNRAADRANKKFKPHYQPDL